MAGVQASRRCFGLPCVLSVGEFSLHSKPRRGLPDRLALALALATAARALLNWRNLDLGG